MLNVSAADIEVAISSAQITSAFGTLILLLLAIIGWLVRSEWKAVNLRLAEIEKNTAVLPGLQTRVESLEARASSLSKRSHRITNVLAVLMDKAGMPSSDFDKEG